MFLGSERDGAEGSRVGDLGLAAQFCGEASGQHQRKGQALPVTSSCQLLGLLCPLPSGESCDE